MVTNEYLSEILKGQEQARAMGRQGLSKNETSAAFQGALEAAYNAEATNRDFSLRKKLGEGTLNIQQQYLDQTGERLKGEKTAELGTFGLTATALGLRAYDMFSKTAATETASKLAAAKLAGTLGTSAGAGTLGTSAGAGTFSFGAANMLGPAYGAETAAVTTPGAFGASNMLGPAYGAETGGPVGAAGAGGYLMPGAVGFAAGSMLGPMIGKLSPVGGAKEKGAIGGAIAGSIFGGAMAGAMAGTAVFPVVGTVVGAILGSVGGLISGGK